ncbi:MAG: peptidoglycan editing factor PgeF [Rhodothermales bacterium]
MAASSAVLLRPRLTTLPHIQAGFSTRHGGVSTGAYNSLNLGLSTEDTADHVQTNRQHFADALGFSANQMAIAGQVHSSTVRVVDEPGLYRGVDGLVTATPGVLLSISAADCASVLFADPEAQVVGACHAGWRGTVAEIAPKTIAEMVRLGAQAEHIHAYISPCISLANFEIGEEVAAHFDEAFVDRSYPKPHADIKGTLLAQLNQAEIPDAHIEVSPHCTFGEVDAFFSHRAERGITGRMMGGIGLTGR